MNRRNFIQATAVTLGATASVVASDARGRQYYELQTYTFKAEKLPLLDYYLEKAFVPTVDHLGFGPVGVFLETESNERDVISGKQTNTTTGDGSLRMFVLLIHNSPESVVSLQPAIERDTQYQKEASAFLAAKPRDPIYQSCSSTLLSAIAGMPSLVRPDKAKPRIFNLRTYGSNNERTAAKKVEMFEKGELEIFKNVKLTPVFFASAYAGDPLPNLTYMLVFPDDAQRKAAWQMFGKDPAWSKLKSTPGYADDELLTRITNRILTPRPYSEL